jgi:hypothetical protein
MQRRIRSIRQKIAVGQALKGSEVRSPLGERGRGLNPCTEQAENFLRKAFTASKSGLTFVGPPASPIPPEVGLPRGTALQDENRDVQSTCEAGSALRRQPQNQGRRAVKRRWWTSVLVPTNGNTPTLNHKSAFSDTGTSRHAKRRGDCGSRSPALSVSRRPVGQLNKFSSSYVPEISTMLSGSNNLHADVGM